MAGNGNVNVVGNSPAFVVNAGTVLVENLTFTTATNSSTIVVNCGSLILRDCTIQSSTGYDQAAILINGGMVNLGTASSPGGNTLNLNGNGGFLQDSTSVPVSGRGDTLEVNGAPASRDRPEPHDPRQLDEFHDLRPVGNLDGRRPGR